MLTKIPASLAVEDLARCQRKRRWSCVREKFIELLVTKIYQSESETVLFRTALNFDCLLYGFRLSRRQNCMKSSRADNRVSCLKTSDVSETNPVAILRESDLFTWGWRRSLSPKRRRFLNNWHGYQPEKISYNLTACVFFLDSEADEMV
jgi:hypothetical protein